MRIEKATLKSLAVKSLFAASYFLVGVVWTVYGLPITDKFLNGPTNYKIYIVGDFKNKEDEGPSQIKRLFMKEERKNAGLRIGGIKVDIEIKQSTEKTAESDSATLAKRNDTLMVIGHLNSSATAAALPNYLSANPPIPIILAIESNPRLLPDYQDKTDYHPAFRLSPTDAEQAKIAAAFMHKQKAKAIWVVEDAVWNPVYTNYLTREFVKQVELQKPDADQHLNANKVLLWTTTGRVYILIP